jgi:hypothetical protein
MAVARCRRPVDRGPVDGTGVAPMSRMIWSSDRMANATADYIVVEPAERDLVRRGARIAAAVAVLVAFAYCASIAWDVLQDLARVSLADVMQALRVVSVRDAILCVVGYRIGRELLVAIVRHRRGA